MKKRLLAVTLALALLAGLLAGCGKKSQTQTQAAQPPAAEQSASGDPAQQSGQEQPAVTAKYAYRTDYRQLTTKLTYIYSMCAADGCVYVSGSVEEDGASRDGVFRVDVDTGECAELQGVALPALPDGWDGGAHVQQIQAADDGSLWLLCSVYTYRYNVPEDFDSQTDAQWNYYEEGESYANLLHITAGGERLSEIMLQPENGEAIGISSFCLDADGNLYANDWQNAYVYDAEGNFLFDVEIENGRRLCRLGDQVGAVETVYSADGNGVNFCFRAIDIASQGLGEQLPLPYGIGDVFQGDEAYDLYYTRSGKIFGYRLADETNEKLVDLLEADVSTNDLYECCLLPDGRVAAVVRADGGAELAVLTRVDASTLPQKTLITLACMYMPYDLGQSIVAFNRTNEQYRIVVNDYSEYLADDGSDDAAITKLNTEILSGKLPDIFVNSGVMPFDLYASKGLLADLYELIDADETLGRETFVQPVLKAIETDGKLYEMPTAFYLQTAFGLNKYVGEYETWTMAELTDAMAKLPEGALVMDPYYTKLDMLSSCLASDMGAFVDWQTGTANFENDKFIELLQFCNTFPEEFDWDENEWAQYGSVQQAMNAGQQLISVVTLSGFEDYVGQCLGYDGGVKIVGFPSSDGSARSTFYMESSFAISASSENRDAAWAFVRERLLEQSASGASLFGFSILQEAFDAAVERAMTVQYRTDENGQTVYDENGEPTKQPKTSYFDANGALVRVYELSQEQVDAVLELINSTTSVYRHDEEVMDIVEDEAAAYFAGEKSAEDVAKMVQNRVSLYMAEQG